ncbi:MAG: ribonuclease P protein component [Methylotetracoccus sp.]
MANGAHRFPRTRRLLSADEFRRVFAESVRASDAYLTILARPNDLNEARIGFAVSRKSLRRACARNRVKRLVREDFRLRQAELTGIDFVVMARSAAASAPASTLRSSLHRHWQVLLRRCASFSSRSSEPTASC